MFSTRDDVMNDDGRTAVYHLAASPFRTILSRAHYELAHQQVDCPNPDHHPGFRSMTSPWEAGDFLSHILWGLRHGLRDLEAHLSLVDHLDH
jgi:hypothetical protein